MTEQRRLSFGAVAELYDRHRPAYPDQLIDDVIAAAGLDGGQTVLEVGPGTGKATLMFAARGISVLGVEPSPEMAAVARRNCATYPGVRIELEDFERWDPAGRTYPLVFSAQAWHWVKPAEGYANARGALLTGGVLAPFWNRVAWSGCELREELLDIYDRIVPQLDRRGPMHPGNLDPDPDADWEAEIAAAGGFGGAEVRFYHWDREYTALQYAGLLATMSEVNVLGAQPRAALLEALTGVIESNGGRLRLPMRTRLCLARRDPFAAGDRTG